MLMLNRGDEHQNLTVSQIASWCPPIYWKDSFEFAMPELNLVSQKLDEKGLWFPLKKDVFRAFDLCTFPPKVVILGQDPYHSTVQINNQTYIQANGLAFSTCRGAPVQPSLNNIFTELKLEYPHYKVPTHGDLTEWALQGVLLLNSCLTVAPHQAGSHGQIWNGFIEKILKKIGQANPNCIYLLWGKSANEWQSSISQKSIIFSATHPSPMSAHRPTKDNPAFMGCNHFTKVNEELTKQGKTPINWQLSN